MDAGHVLRTSNERTSRVTSRVTLLNPTTCILQIHGTRFDLCSRAVHLVTFLLGKFSLFVLVFLYVQDILSCFVLDLQYVFGFLMRLYTPPPPVEIL